MQPIQFFAARAEDGALLPGATVNVFITGTRDHALLAKDAEGAFTLANPLTADGNGRVLFYTAAPRIDIQISRGGYVAPLLVDIRTSDPADVLSATLTAAERAESARDAAQYTSNWADDVAQGLASGKPYFVVPSPVSDEYLVLYKNVGGMAVELDRLANWNAVKNISSIIRGFGSAAVETEIMKIVDLEGGLFADLTNQRMSLPFVGLISGGQGMGLLDAEGNAAFYSDPTRTIAGPMEFRYTEYPSVVYVDAFDQVIWDPLETPQSSGGGEVTLPFEGGLLFQPKIAIGQNFEPTLYPASMLTHRNRIQNVVASLNSTTTGSARSADELPVTASYGVGAVLNLRPRNSPNDRRFMALNIIKVPQQSARPVKVLMIGDSIVNRQGAYLMDLYLRELGFIPTFIGLLAGIGADGVTSNGPMTEGRSGWESGDFTFAVTDRALPIVPGEEAAFLALGKGARVTYNTFIRPATAGDNPSLVRNGYVFDCAFYQSRFPGFVETPDIVVNALGTNDFRDRTEATIYDTVYDTVYDNDRIIHSQIRAAWPAAKIIRAVPGTSINDDRNSLWTRGYSRGIQAIQQCAKDLADPLLTIAPL